MKWILGKSTFGEAEMHKGILGCFFFVVVFAFCFLFFLITCSPACVGLFLDQIKKTVCKFNTLELTFIVHHPDGFID